MDLTALVEVARSLWVVWLMAVFGGIVFWAMRPKNKKRFEDDAMIIFKHDDKNGGPAHG
jgi:cytochrome c oxidase cbb3-type subunit 4